MVIVRRFGMVVKMVDMVNVRWFGMVFARWFPGSWAWVGPGVLRGRGGQLVCRRGAVWLDQGGGRDPGAQRRRASGEVPATCLLGGLGPGRDRLGRSGGHGCGSVYSARGGGDVLCHVLQEEVPVPFDVIIFSAGQIKGLR